MIYVSLVGQSEPISSPQIAFLRRATFIFVPSPAPSELYNPPSSPTSERSGAANDALEVEAGWSAPNGESSVRPFVFSTEGMHIITARKFVVRG